MLVAVTTRRRLPLLRRRHHQARQPAYRTPSVMGFGVFFRAAFLSAGALVCSFAIAVAVSDPARAFYERHVEHWLEAVEFFFTWLGSIYNILPMVAFITVDDWARVFFDCFTPFSMWLDVLYSLIFLAHLLVFVGDLERNYGRIVMEFSGLAMQLVAIIGYVLQKLAYDESYAKNEAKQQYLWAMIFIKLSGLAVLIQIQFKVVAPEGQGYWGIAVALTLFGVGFQFLQIVASIVYRSFEDNFKDDPTKIKRVKLGAALIKVIAMSYDCWLFYARGYWQLPEKRMLPVMTAGSLFLTCTVALGRDVGPEKLRKVYLACIKADGIKTLNSVVRKVYLACAGGIKALFSAVRKGVARLMNPVVEVLQGVYLANKIDRDSQRRAEPADQYT